MSKTELAWAAGFFEGEGCVAAHPNGRLSLVVQQAKDPWTLERFQAAVGDVGQINGPYEPKFRDPARARYRYSPLWRWTTGAQGSVAAVMELLRPYLGERSDKLRKYQELAPLAPELTRRAT